tara:strand:- start:305 stop:766 length:462 start_codon:yes stop_codon:yes gene_type:complete
MKQIIYWWFFIITLFLISVYFNLKCVIQEGNKEFVEYEPNELDIEYHISIDDLLAQDMVDGITRVVDKSGNLVKLETDFQQAPILYQPTDKYKFNLANYVPDYEDVTYLSKTHGVFKKKQPNRDVINETKRKYTKDVNTLLDKRIEDRSMNTD